MSTPVARLFAAADAKLVQAESQIAELEKRSQEFFAPLVADLSARIDAASTGEAVSIDVPQEVAEGLSVLCGQIALLLRSPLDYLACELARKHSGTADKTAFPFGNAAPALEDAIRQKAKRLSDEAKDFIRAQQPRMDGDYILWSLNEICNIDKHRGLISGKAIVAIGGVPAGEPYGYVTGPDWNAVATGATSVPLVRQPLFNFRIKTTCTMAFAEPSALQNKPVASTLSEMQAKVKKIMEDAKPLLQ